MGKQTAKETIENNLHLTGDEVSALMEILSRALMAPNNLQISQAVSHFQQKLSKIKTK